MVEFKVGDKVRCVNLEDYGFADCNDAADSLKIGQVYTVAQTDYDAPDPEDAEEYGYGDDHEWAITLTRYEDTWFHVHNFEFAKITNAERVAKRKKELANV